MAQQLNPLLPPTFPLVDSQGKPTPAFQQYQSTLDAIVRLLTGGNQGLVNAANDVAAAAAGVQINQLYRNGNAVQIRLT